ncbi:MAG: ChaN family lipoprotein [Casimicrobiaceae bacterium]
MKIDPTPAALAHAMQGHRIVLLGEVHDNPVQHALRAAALQRLLATGVRPAIAFEQFDREHQTDIDRARRERPADADYLIAQAKGDPGWNWNFYRPYVALALEYDLPIVAANLSRDDAMKVAIDGWRAVFDAATIRQLGLDALPTDLRRSQEHAMAVGHCNLLPAEMLPPRANAQMARDIVMAQSIRPYSDHGVVLLAGNGHVRRDIGVPVWLSAAMRASAISIGLLETNDDGSTPDSGADFDAYVVTGRAERADPCKELAKRMHPGMGR